MGKRIARGRMGRSIEAVDDTRAEGCYCVPARLRGKGTRTADGETGKERRGKRGRWHWDGTVSAAAD